MFEACIRRKVLKYLIYYVACTAADSSVLCNLTDVSDTTMIIPAGTLGSFPYRYDYYPTNKSQPLVMVSP